MKPLIVLLIAFVVSAFSIRFVTHSYNFPLSARVAMCAMLFFAAIGHFAFTKGMQMMMPGFIPFKKEIVYFTGMVEIILGIGLLIANLSIYSAWILILFFILLLPANINAAVKHVDYQKGTFEGSGLNYLWFRIPLQILFIAWTYYSSIKYY